MKHLWIQSTALILLLLSVCLGAVAEDLAVPLISMNENNRKGISSDGLIPWENGFISFDVVISSDAQGCPDGVTASVSYYAKNGKAAEEVLGWDLVLNSHDDLPVHCDLWYVFPDGQQANYTNPVPAGFCEDIYACRLVPLLADGLSSVKYPAVMGSTAEPDQTVDKTDAGSPADCGTVDGDSICTCVCLTEND